MIYTWTSKKWSCNKFYMHLFAYDSLQTTLHNITIKAQVIEINSDLIINKLHTTSNIARLNEL